MGERAERVKRLLLGPAPRALLALCAPTLFAHGSVDPFGSLDELEAARRLVPARTALVAIDGAGHGLARGTRAFRPAAGTVGRIVDGFLAFVGD